MFYTDELYDQIILKNARKHDCLRVITGYCSGKFVQRVHHDFPQLRLIIYIGMAQEGIGKDDHKVYQDLTQNPNIEIYYHCDKNKTHQKVLEFSNPTTIGYVGSANFSGSGFGKHKEILVETTDDLTRVFSEEASHCVICTNPLIEELISITENSYGETSVSETSSSEIESEVSSENSRQSENIVIDISSENTYDGNEIRIPLIPNRNTWEWDGINDSVLTLTNRYSTDLPPTFDIIFNGQRYAAKFIQNKNIKLIDNDFKTIITNYLGFDPNKKITPKQLENIQKTHVSLKISGYKQYRLEFCK